MPTYRQPTFNVVANIWRSGVPTTNPPTLSCPANLSPGRLVQSALSNIGTNTDVIGGMWLRVPMQTDIRDSKWAGGADIIEVPAGTARYYRVLWVDDIGIGFANEHRFAEILGYGPWPVPFPSTSPPSTIFVVGTNVGSSAPALVNQINFNMPVGALSTAFVAVNIGNNAGFPTCTFNGIGAALAFPTVAHGAGALTANGYLFSSFLPGGVYNVAVQIPAAGVGYIQWSAWYVSVVQNVIDQQGGNFGGASNPTNQNALVSALAPAAFASMFSMVNPGGVPVWAAPFNLVNANVIDVIGADTLALSAGTRIETALGANPIALLNTILPASWAGVMYDVG